MRLCVAQTRPVKGDVRANIEHHKRLVDLAVSNRADIVVFPELSLTGYEPTLSKSLATSPLDPRLDEFQTISDANGLTIGAGIPAATPSGIGIGMVVFQPRRPRQMYFKQYLHRDEEPFFAPGESPRDHGPIGPRIAIAICYEISVDEHVERAVKDGAEVYLASVAKTESGAEAATRRLADIARQHAMTALMANCVGECDGVECAGRTSIWNNQGVLVGQLNRTDEGILLFDTETHECVQEA